MTGSKSGGDALPMSRDDFNARARALSARLGPIAKPQRAAPPRQTHKPPFERPPGRPVDRG